MLKHSENLEPCLFSGSATNLTAGCLSECKINTYVLIFDTAKFMWSVQSFNPKTYKMTSEDNEEAKKKYITKCMRNFIQNNAVVPTELSEVMLSYLLDAAKKNLLYHKTLATYVNHLHYSMRSVGSIFSEVKRQRYLKKFAILQNSSLIQTLAINSRLVQMIAVSTTERNIILDHIKTVVDEDGYWTTHLEVIELFYQILENDEVDFESIDSTLRSITNINMIKSKYLSNVVYKIMKHYCDTGLVEQADSLYNFIR